MVAKTAYSNNLLLWMGGRAVEGSSLENWRGGNLTVGSNPTPSANYRVFLLYNNGLHFVVDIYPQFYPL